jgi:purine nucleosidase
VDGTFDRDEVSRIAAVDTPLARFVVRVCETTLAFNESVGVGGSTHPDSLTAAVLLHPELVAASARYAVDVEADSELTRGYSAMSWGRHGLEPNATVIESVDRLAFLDYLIGLLETPTTPPRTFRPAL